MSNLAPSTPFPNLAHYTRGNNNLAFIGGNEDVVSELVRSDGFRKVPNRNYGALPPAQTPPIPDGIAISVESAQKKFGELKILEGLNMHVQTGKIYGLLGSSGCGKTTLLSCVVGLRELDSGRIRICGKSPGEPGSGVPGRLVGYMPQEIALNGEFTIREVAHFFGRLYGMRKGKVEERLFNLLKLLDLTKSTKLIKKLSGGEKRRASFLIALLHEPQILILDEPTVGIDPLLALNIWKHLGDLVENLGTTVIITTHCIEEMRHADRVGIMRNGMLMVEDSPKELMAAHSAKMLEEVVLKYCLRANESEVLPDVATSVSPYDPPRRHVGAQMPGSVRAQSKWTKIPWGSKKNAGHDPDYRSKVTTAGIQTNSFHRTSALVHKNVTVMMRSIGLLLFLFLTPASVVAVYCYCMGSDPSGLGLGIVNEDGPDCQLASGWSIREMALPCTPQNLSCALIKQLEGTGAFTIKFYPSEKMALDKVDELEIWGYVHFQRNFSRHFFDRMLNVGKGMETIDGAKISVRLDMSTVQTGGIIKKLVYEAYGVFARNFAWGCGLDPTLLELPISIQKPIYGTENLRMSNFLAPGMTIAFIMSLTAITAGLVLILEKKDGMVERTKVAGVTTFEIMLSHFIPQIGVIFVQNLSAFLVMFLAFEIPHEGSLALAFALAIWFEMSGTILGLMASTVFDNEKNAMLLSIAASISIYILAGFTFPLETLAFFFRKMATILPGTHAGESIRSIFLRGWGIRQYSVYIGFITPLLFMLLYSAITFAILKRRK